MIGAGIVCFVLGFFFIVVSARVKDEEDAPRTLLGAIGGILIMFGLNFSLPPFKDRTNEDIQVITKEAPLLKKEIHVDTENNADTTYYYIFKNSSVVPYK